MVKIAVLGAGINGVSCALKIKEKYPSYNVVLISKHFTPHTTGDGSGGLWYPYLCGNTSEALIRKWGLETYSYYRSLYKQCESKSFLSYMPMYSLYQHRSNRDADSRPMWAQHVDNYQQLDRLQLYYLSQLYSNQYVGGHTFNTYVVHPPTLLARLQREYQSLGGAVVRGGAGSLRHPLLREYDVIVNCTGLAAGDIVPDGTVFPIRGQLVKVKAPWINVTVIDNDTGCYVIPNAETCVLGGTHQENDYNTKENKKDTKFIIDQCTKMIPSLKHAQKLGTWVGLRPGRGEIRLEAEPMGRQLVIHNYGHGGSGLTLFWGCANEVVNILDSYLHEKQHHSPTIASSKL